ncbi:PH domain-containing protein [Streptomyces sp. NPDC006641]|uniref:PH domain-containing protein n=1 Tax=unclassified Streptomyces TaxID=2593676 RepID=UPI002E77D520|nr:PH domain-containing protein [Streptomyces sp. JV184]MEE1744528.1 PH domain-containing protein [Streptomyces sp. JV184]
MNDVREVICRPRRRLPWWFLVGLGAAGASLAAVRGAYRGTFLDAWLSIGVLLALLGVLALGMVTTRVSADAYGVHSRTLLRRRSVPWGDITGLRILLKHESSHRIPEVRRVGLVLRNGRRRLLPLPQCGLPDDRAEFDAKVDALHALHVRHGAPDSSHIPVISRRTAGRSVSWALILCALLLAGAGAAAWAVPDSTSYARAWQSAVPCAAGAGAGTGTTERRDCLTTVPAVIAKAEVRRPKQSSWLYFADGRPLERLAVSREGAQGFGAGDSVEVTFWRDRVMKVAGAHHVWREHVSAAGEMAVLAAALALTAGYPAARVLLRLRGRRLPDDEVLPSALPFVGVLVGTALWLLPLCYRHPTDPFTSPATIAWAAAGSAATLGLSVLAWRATRVRTPRGAESTGKPGKAGAADEVFVAARFLEQTDYNPHFFGTHIVLGDGPPAVTPHSGPGRFAAKPIPVERLTVKGVRRLRGSDGDTVPGGWHIAELDDAGSPVRLAAAPADLTRIIRELRPAAG